MSKLAGKVAIVTGGTSGMGRAIAGRFAHEGAAIVLGGRNVERGAAVVTEVRRSGGRCVFIAGDVADPEVNRRLVDAAVDAFGGVDVLVTNVGTLGLGSVTEVALDVWHETISVNLHSVFYLLRSGIPELKKRGGGTVVVNGSIAAVRAFPNHAAYCAAKAALRGLVRQAAVDYGPDIRVNMMCPGPVDTPLLWDSARAFPDPATAVADAGRRTQLGRIGTPDEVASLALFLASDDSSWITGAAYTIDGGATCA
jgi:NAD(P)-dependent dehydrogenase (short-subunit alcohol dehydrogenase family)